MAIPPLLAYRCALLAPTVNHQNIPVPIPHMYQAISLFLEDGRVAIDNNPAERALRPVCLTRKNALFCGSDAGGDTFADAMTIISIYSDHCSIPFWPPGEYA